ncbi:MAG: riboflavin synthase [Proteobacteria bacterium]|jgi:riboflavin synthase|nr:riboflavin synthase [Pseudomonadota bacterium]MBK7114809.1 riboflavin synthase [Pseudomonadota bacterium]MBK9251861.1 riboflavin synthase [Pseudomonadota bacterium]
MFTGIIQATGTLARIEPLGGDLRLTFDVRELASRIEARRLALGESIAVSGACLTVIAFDGQRFSADVSRETLRLTTLGRMTEGAEVNLEAALRAGDPLGGHLMSGHVDGLAQVVGLQADARSLRVEVEVPAELARYLAPKGSVGLDGVSLTVNSVDGRRFSVNLIPHTVAVTALRSLALGQWLNLEVDQLARYVERGLLHLRP